ncbi:MAG TPA: hypothetical protein VHZ50_03035 [Puia sp.]|nr:hypothetical protein [Puia sp.]
MDTKVSCHKKIESLKKDEALTGTPKNKKPEKFNAGFISSLHLKVADKISKIKIRKFFRQKL